MVGGRLRELRAVLALGGFAVFAGALSTAAAVAHTSPAGADDQQVQDLAARVGADLSSAALGRFAGAMSPDIRSIVLRYDPAGRRAEASPLWAQADGGFQAPPDNDVQQMTPTEAMLLNASIPFSMLPNPAAQAFTLRTDDAQAAGQALTCLSAAVYYEAASESDDGQAAVAQVVLNRLRHPLFPKSICAVVFQGWQLKTGCQFTFTCDGSLDRKPDAAGWARAQRIAARALGGYVMKSVGEATHYHTEWVFPYWSPSLVKLTKIGAHIFYRWSGTAGLPRAFGGLYAGSEANAWGAVQGRLIKVGLTAEPPQEEPPVVEPVQTVALQTVAVTAAAPAEAVAVELAAAPVAANVKVQPLSFQGVASRQPPPPPRIAAPSNW